MSDLSKTENERIRELMRQWLLRTRSTITDLARELKREQPSLSVFLGGTGGVSFATARRFAKLIGVNVTTLLDGLDTGHPANPSPPTPLDLAENAARTLWPEHAHKLPEWVEKARPLVVANGTAEDWFESIRLVRRMELSKVMAASPEPMGAHQTEQPRAKRRSTPPAKASGSR
ncbi:MAG TPA: hypothetical protein VFU97_24625 [Xanthobacteraceae bacterium]|nr:hypothetical protein [Xanthobacteraceae bacterium]